MESTSSGWWHRHGWTVAILLSAFGISFALRTVWAYPVVSQWGPLFTYAGGSDSYYHSRVMQYIILNHTNLIHDPLLQFPVGAINPREPLFDWMNAILGIIFAPFFGGNAVVAGAWFLDLQAPLWAALGVFPVYLIGREVSGRRTGLIAAIIFPFLSGNIDSSIFGYANYLSFYTFVILVVVYSYIRTVKAVGSRRWVEEYRHPRQYIPAVRAFLRTERGAVKWAVFTGVSLGALALAWQGYTYGVVVIAISLVAIMVIERIRRVDSFGLYVSTWIVGAVGFPMAFPYYIVQQQFIVWFELPLLIFFGALLLLLPFLLMRDIPWVFSVPFLVLSIRRGRGPTRRREPDLLHVPRHRPGILRQEPDLLDRRRGPGSVDRPVGARLRRGDVLPRVRGARRLCLPPRSGSFQASPRRLPRLRPPLALPSDLGREVLPRRFADLRAPSGRGDPSGARRRRLRGAPKNHRLAL